LESGTQVEILDHRGGVAVRGVPVPSLEVLDGTVIGLAFLAQGLAPVITNEVVGNAVEPGEDRAATVRIGADTADSRDEDRRGYVRCRTVVKDPGANVTVYGWEVCFVDSGPCVLRPVLRAGDERLLVTEAAAIGYGGIFPLVLEYDRPLPPKDYPPLLLVFIVQQIGFSSRIRHLIFI
jgi:hypothetical protein